MQSLNMQMCWSMNCRALSPWRASTPQEAPIVLWGASWYPNQLKDVTGQRVSYWAKSGEVPAAATASTFIVNLEKRTLHVRFPVCLFVCLYCRTAVMMTESYDVGNLTALTAREKRARPAATKLLLFNHQKFHGRLYWTISKKGLSVSSTKCSCHRDQEVRQDDVHRDWKQQPLSVSVTGNPTDVCMLHKTLHVTTICTGALSASQAGDIASQLAGNAKCMRRSQATLPIHTAHAAGYITGNGPQNRPNSHTYISWPTSPAPCISN